MWPGRLSTGYRISLLLLALALPALFGSAQEPPVIRFDAPLKIDCPACGNIGLVPIKNRPDYVHIEGAPAPRPEDAVRAAACPRCRANVPAARLVELEAERLMAAGEFHKEWEGIAGMPFQRVETHHGTYHLALPEEEARKIGPAVEALTLHLQTHTGSMELTPSTPATYNLFLLWQKPPFEKFRDAMAKKLEAEKKTVPFNRGEEVGGYLLGDLPSFCYDVPEHAADGPPVHHAVAFTAIHQIGAATRGRCGAWLMCGFGAYGEQVVLKKVRTHLVYDPGQRLGTIDLMAEARQMAAMGKMQPWEEVVKLELRDFAMPQYVQSCAMVAFLLQEPKPFLALVRALREGKPAAEALEAAYGAPLANLEARWLKWLK